VTSAGEVLELLGGGRVLSGEPASPVERAAPLARARAGDLTFVSRVARPDAIPVDVTAALVILDEPLAEDLDRSGWSVDAVIVSPNARLDFIRAVSALFGRRPAPGIHPSAVIGEGAVIAEDVMIGPLASIGPHVVVGRGSAIHAGVHLYEGTRVGADVTIHAGTVVGADGFGYERQEDGSVVQFPHLGGVVIGDGVDIGANACIDRGTLDDTVIEAGARIDNLVHIAHNVRVGADALVIANAMIGGGTQIGAGSWIAPTATLRESLVVGERATVGLGAVVTRDVPPDAVVMGNPARPLDEAKAQAAALKRLASSG
jgi:UDP-3-O-[3-hydroxymyristoyl] glucosamine N-acyltransferase